jgi:drug/metabolite transporter (DMT)-like permease
MNLYFINMDKKVLYAFLCMFFAVFIWGSTFSIVKKAIEEISIPYFLFLRFFFASISLIPFVIIENKKKTKYKNNKTIVTGVLAGLVLFLCYILQTEGIKTTSATTAGFLTSLYVVFTPILLFFTKKENANYLEWISVSIAVLGVYLINKIDGSGMNLGNVLIILSALFYSLHILIISSIRSTKLPVLFTFMQLSSVCFLTLVLALFSSSISLILTPPKTVFVAALFSGLVSTSLCYFIQTWSLRYLTVIQSSLIFSLEPVFASLAGKFLLNEPFSKWIVIGGGLILFSIILTQISRLLIINKD